MYTIRCNTGADILRGRIGCQVVKWENGEGRVIVTGSYDRCKSWIDTQNAGRSAKVAA